MFTDDQKKELAAPLNRDNVKTREQGGRNVSYVEGWHVIAEANRIFGFDAWSSETTMTTCVAEKERLIGKKLEPGFGVTYTAKVRITVGNLVREGTGTGHGIDRDLGQAHESAIKEAETDARKRAMMTFGNPFGLALYDKEQANVASDFDIQRQQFIESTHRIIGEKPVPELVAWINSDEQKLARKDFKITMAELEAMKTAVAARLPPRTGTQNAQG